MLTTGLALGWIAGCGGAPESAPPPSQPADTPSQSKAPDQETSPEQPTAGNEPTAAAQPTAPSQPTVPVQPTAQASPPDQPAAAPKKNSPDIPQLGQGVGTGTSSNGSTPGSQESNPKQPAVEKKPRPEELADWKLEDYLSAKREEDSRLVEAIQGLGSRHKGDPSIVKILAAILARTKPDEQPVETESGPSNPAPKRHSPSSISVGSGISTGGTPSRGKRRTARANQPVIAAAIDALAENKTNEARKLLREIVLGKFQTDSDTAATPLAMWVVMDQDTPENHALMLRTLVESEKLRKGSVASTSDSSSSSMTSDSEKPMTADELHKQAVELLDTTASERFRVKLMKYLLSDKASGDHRKELVPIMGKPLPENVAAQLLVYQAPVADQLKPDYEKYFAELSSIALGHVLGVLADKEPEVDESEEKPSKEPDDDGWGGIKPRSGRSKKRGAPGISSIGGEISSGGGGLSSGANLSSPELDDPNVIYPLAAKLWSKETVATVIQRNQEDTASEGENTTLALARTMPVDRVRAGLCALLRERFKDGPDKVLGKGGSPNGRGSGGIGGEIGLPIGSSIGSSVRGKLPKEFWDPGFLIVMKSLPIDKKVKRPKKTKQSSSRSAIGGGVGGSTSGDNAGDEPETPSEKWLDATEQIVKLFCQQCRAAAQDLPEDMKKLPKMPVKPHAKAPAKLHYCLKLPEDAGNKLGAFKIDPIEIHYMRIEGPAQLTRILKHYGRVTRTKPRETDRNEFWFDSLKSGSTEGNIRSSDVIVTTSGGRGIGGMATSTRRRQREPEVPVVIEILTVETQDPAGS